jgi:hypothetical protein
MEQIFCSQCREPVSAGFYNRRDLVPCPSCRAPIQIDVFPAFYRGLQPGKAGETLLDEQASCFFHPQKKAAIPCDHCGRFLCALCDVELNGKHLCPVCLEKGEKGKILSLDRHRPLYDAIALKLALYPIITIWFTLVTAPIALYIAIRHRNAPTSIVRRSKIRFHLAAAVSVLQILAWAVLIVYFLSR